MGRVNILPRPAPWLLQVLLPLQPPPLPPPQPTTINHHHPPPPTTTTTTNNNSVRWEMPSIPSGWGLCQGSNPSANLWWSYFGGSTQWVHNCPTWMGVSISSRQLENCAPLCYWFTSWLLLCSLQPRQMTIYVCLSVEGAQTAALADTGSMHTLGRNIFWSSFPKHPITASTKGSIDYKSQSFLFGGLHHTECISLVFTSSEFCLCLWPWYGASCIHSIIH